MGWFEKHFGGRSDDSDGQHKGKTTIPIAWNEPYEYSDVHPEVDEDFYRAIALSLLDEHGKGKAIDINPGIDEDEQLARALQESLYVDSPQYNSQHSSGSRRCAGCNKEISDDGYINAVNARWHTNCFCCHGCNKPITDHEYSMTGEYHYHKSCYRDRYLPKCDVCKEFIPTNRNRLIEYQSHLFWKHKNCLSHETDGTPRCCSCERMEPRDTKYISLDDGRKLCLECLNFSIMDSSECQPLYIQIREFYEGLNMRVEQDIPLLLVKREALNEAIVVEKNDGSHHYLPETRGLCLAEEQIVSNISRRPTIEPGNKIGNLETSLFRTVRHCEITGILILYGLPRLATGSILAHEMMHAWLRLNGYHSLSPQVEEGICQVLAHMWIESVLMSGTSLSSHSSSSVPYKRGVVSPFEKKFAEFVKHQIERDTSSVYGAGFRAGNKAVDKYGLRSTLDHMKHTEKFPH